MKWNWLLRSLAVWGSSGASIFAGHALHALPLENKDPKTTKKARTNQTRFDDSWLTTPEIENPPEKQNPPESPSHVYEWRKDIVTTTFWIGEDPTPNNPVPNHKSSWDTKWAENYGGTDHPEKKKRTDAYLPADFFPRQNPFYIALPYNDMTSKGHKPEASRVIPWFHKTYENPHKSVLKGRWIAIRRGDRICYAQWEDVGPFRTDHWQYVFGKERPSPNLNKGAGLDVSPAVRDFLGMDSTDVTDWKFVEFSEVPEGPWARYGDNNTFVINKRKAEEAVAKLEQENQATRE